MAAEMFVSPDPAPDAGSMYQAKQKRETAATAGNYLGAMWRQDSPVDGIVAHIAGTQMAPDANYSVFEPRAWTAATAGVPDEYHKEFYAATSAAHAEYIRQRLFSKFDDQQQLGDLGLVGNAGRILFSLVEPTSLLAGIASGGIYTAVRGVTGASRALGVARTAGDVAGAARAAGDLAVAAGREAKAPALLAGITANAGFNAGFEKLRQSVSFEDNDTAVLEAALVGAAFATPFVALKAREMSKLHTTADMERRVLTVVRKEREGVPLDEHDVATATEYRELMKHIEDVETGKIDAGSIPTPSDPRAITPKQAAGIKREAARKSVARADEFEKARASVDSTKQAEMDALWADGHLAKADAEARVQDILTTVNGDTKLDGPMQAAFAKLMGKQADTATNLKVTAKRAEEKAAQPPTPAEALTPVGKPATQPDAAAAQEAASPSAPSDAVPSSEVFWRDKNGDTVVGEVVGVNPNGSLKIDLHPDFSPFERVKGRYISKRRESLDMDSPHYEAPEVPEGFLPGSVGAAQVQPLPVPQLSPDYENVTALAKYRGDMFAVLNKSANPFHQELGSLLARDSIGNSSTWAQKRTASEIKKNISRTLGGHFHAESKDAWNEVVKTRGLGLVAQANSHQEFYENVTAVARGDKQVLIDNADIAGPLNKAASAMRHVYSTLAVRAQKSGLEGAEGLMPNEHYVNRVWNHNNIRAEIARFDELHGKGNGRAELDKALAAAIPGFRNDVAKAHSFLDAVRKLEFSRSMQDIQLLGKDMAALRAELNKHLSGDESDAIVDIMFASKKAEPDAGNPTNLRYRLDLDENYRETLKDGTEFRVSDLFENDSRLLVDSYISSIGGHTALAEKGITSRAAFEATMRQAGEWHDANKADSGDATLFKREQQHAEDLYKNVIGQPMSMQTFNRADRVLGTIRSYTRAAVLGQLGIAAAFELKNALGLATGRAMYQQMPTFRQFIQAARSGHVADDKLGEGVESFLGFGREAAASHARVNEISDFTYERGLTRSENFANKASHAVDVISGNRFFTSFTRKWTARGMIQKHFNVADGKLKLTDSMRERFVHNGLNANEMDQVFSKLKEHATVDSKGVVQELDWEKWQQSHPKSYDSYTLLVEREVRDAIQDHDIGATYAFQHGTIGKTFGELRTFNIAGHSMQFLKGIFYHDRTTAATWTLSFLGEAMAYALQTSANYAHNQQELDKRLTIERISAAAVQRMSVLGISSFLLETGANFTGHSLTQSGTTANTDQRNMFITPSMALAQKAFKGVNTLVNSANPASSNRATQRDVKDLLGTLPGGNAWVMRNIVDHVSSQFPKSELRPGQ
jgi:hypothetical protein